MLVLTRKKHESILIDGTIVITLLSLGKNRISVGIEAPSEVNISRDQIHHSGHIRNQAIYKQDKQTTDD